MPTTESVSTHNNNVVAPPRRNNRPVYVLGLATLLVLAAWFAAERWRAYTVVPWLARAFGLLVVIALGRMMYDGVTYGLKARDHRKKLTLLRERARTDPAARAALLESLRLWGADLRSHMPANAEFGELYSPLEARLSGIDSPASSSSDQRMV